MITLKTLRWSNAFSYGKDNVVSFIDGPLTQLVGKNGHGKSSVALILEEVLFNKNSKGIKKADILNRYTKDKSYTIELEFDKDGTDYEIKTTRGTTQGVKLYKTGTDISAHTATATYKIIEDIIGFDHKTFAQIVYQSSASSLEFLTAPDTARKKFLIELLNLGKYTKAQEVFKEVATVLSKELAVVESQIKTVNSWLDKYGNTDLSNKNYVEVPVVKDTLISGQAEISNKLETLEATNKKITKNNTYKQIQGTLKLFSIPAEPANVDLTLKTGAKSASTEQIELNKTIRDSQAFVKKMHGLSGTCPTCLQTIDEAKIAALLTEQQSLQANASARFAELDAVIKEYQDSEAVIKLEVAAFEKATKAKEEWEKYHSLIDTSLPETLLDQNDLQRQFDDIQHSITELRAAIAKAEKHNREAEAHNTKVEIVSKQLVEMNEDLETYSGTMHELSEKMGRINILSKTFSTTGLVAYKIECLVKDLEELTNQYLVDLSDGRFQIAFRISSSDKLNVVITDNSRDIDILALSGGERARVNVATLLAIRKLMQSLSSSRINLLILDETVEALDIDGKERLVEVLLKEEYLNTFLVSHGFTHPLLEKINVVKSNNISHIES
jgi:DNA repair exonuclease SbcCD ATPase subunit